MAGYSVRLADVRAALGKLIVNDDRPGNWFVNVYATRSAVCTFQCRTPEEAAQAVQLIQQDRAASRLTTTRATRTQLISGRGRNSRFGPINEIALS